MEENFNIVSFLKSAVATGASDEHLKVGFPPFVRVNGSIKKTNLPPITLEILEKAILDIAPTNVYDSLSCIKDIDFAYEIQGVSRFRVNYNKQLGKPAMVIRNIPYVIPDLKDLKLPEYLGELINHKNGIIFVTGPTGSGKSTTLASLINQIIKKDSKHIITIEDPVEYVFTSQKGIISQRQVEVDTNSFSSGIKYSLRQDPDVIFVGEIRDKETMEAALKAAETGHLVLTTLHTNDAVQTINRIVNMFEESNRYLIRKQLAETLRATIAQKLVYSEKHNKRFPACEILTVTPTIRDYIVKDNANAIYELVRENNIDSMISMNMSLFLLASKDLISKQEAIENSNDPDELEKLFRGAYLGTKGYYE